MKIYRMTATFGKLNNQTLTLKPDLNIIEAPNEWGKSTWCAFLIAMLYGIPSSARSTKDSLAAKEHYAPWSGAPMSGSMDICWNSRDITIQRAARGRVPFGEFQAYETATGLPVPELTAANCGQMLLGVEQGVFARTGFLRLADLPVTDDKELRKRLNALVTTGDESGTEEHLSKTLKELRNRCRFHKTGLLPQEEAKRSTLQNKLQDMDALERLCENITQQQASLEARIQELNTHKEALAYEKAQQEQALLQKARTELARLREKAEDLSVRCANLPSGEETRYKLSQLGDLQQKWARLQAKELPSAPIAPQPPATFAGLDGAAAVQRATADTRSYQAQAVKKAPAMLILAALFLLAGVGLCFVNPLLLLPSLAASGAFFWLHTKTRAAEQKRRDAIALPYGNSPAESWISLAEHYLREEKQYKDAADAYRAVCTAAEKEKAELTAALNQLTLGRTVSDCLSHWNEILACREELEDVQKAYAQAKMHEGTLSSVVKETPAPRDPDTLTYTEAETARYLTDAVSELKNLQTRLGHYQGQITALGNRDAITRELAVVNGRISALEDYYAALTVALETATEASQELQRRFAPGISKNAQALFARMTGGRYDKLTLSQDFSLQVSARNETTLRGTLWRSDGTVDQLYLALRLAVARVLSPTAPLVLDDALVRFDDTRLTEALHILQEESAQKQVILFTCQSREAQALASLNN